MAYIIVDKKTIQKLNLNSLLTDDKLMKAIDSNNKNDLRDLLLEAIHLLIDNNVKLNNLYYAEHIALSDELFDMFSSSCLDELFSLFGYKTELICDDTNFDTWIGKMKIFNDNIEIELFATESMHDNLITIFVDTKISKYIKK